MLRSDLFFLTRRPDRAEIVSSEQTQELFGLSGNRDRPEQRQLRLVSVSGSYMGTTREHIRGNGICSDKQRVVGRGSCLFQFQLFPPDQREGGNGENSVSQNWNLLRSSHHCRGNG